MDENKKKQYDNVLKHNFNISESDYKKKVNYVGLPDVTKFRGYFQYSDAKMQGHIFKTLKFYETLDQALQNNHTEIIDLQKYELNQYLFRKDDVVLKR